MSPEAQRKLRDQETGLKVGASIVAFLFGYPILAGYIADMLGMSCEMAVFAFVIVPLMLAFVAITNS